MNAFKKSQMDEKSNMNKQEKGNMSNGQQKIEKAAYIQKENKIENKIEKENKWNNKKEWKKQ